MVVAEVCSSMKYPKRCQYKHAKQKKYHVRNWAEYNEGLRRRGDLTVWFDEEAIANWKADKTGKPGGQRVYSDMAIETGLVVWMVYKLAYRQTEGFLHSIASLLGLGIEIPDYSTLCRRSRLLRKKLRIPKAASTQPIHLMIDSTGLRIHVGNARKPPKQRAWRKLHIAVDRETGNIVASELTASRARDATRVPALLTQIQAPLVSVAADRCIRQGSGLRSHRSAQSWTKDARGDSAATKRDAQSEFEHRHAGARSPYFVPSKDTADVNGTSSQATPSEAWWRTRSIVTRRSSGRRCGLERWRGNELNTELGARYSTRWLRSGCPIRTAPGDSATGTGRSAICSGPCNNAKLRWQSEERLFDGVVERSPVEPERPEVVLGIELRSARESAVRFVDAPQQSKGQSSDFVGFDVIFVERGSLVGEAKGLLRLSLLEVPETELDKILAALRAASR